MSKQLQKIRKKARLRDAVFTDFKKQYGYDIPKEVLENPKWGEFCKSHRHIQDWRSYIPDVVIAYWDDLDIITKAALYYMGYMQADCEEWD